MHKKYSTKYIIERHDLTADLKHFISKQKKISAHQAITRHSFLVDLLWVFSARLTITRDNHLTVTQRAFEWLRSEIFMYAKHVESDETINNKLISLFLIRFRAI